MRTLYEIDNDILSCIDTESGEIDEERLSGLEKERNKKVEMVALWCIELGSDITAYKAEEERFKAKRKQAEKTVESLKRWLQFATDGEKFHSDKVDVTFRKSKQLVIGEDAFIPPTYYKIKKEVDKAKLKADILSGEIHVDGCEVVEKLNTGVK